MAGQEVQTPVSGSRRSTLERQDAPSYPPQQNMSPSRLHAPRQDRFVPIGVIGVHCITYVQTGRFAGYLIDEIDC
jgi:hypothetical protein